MSSLFQQSYLKHLRLGPDHCFPYGVDIPYTAENSLLPDAFLTDTSPITFHDLGLRSIYRLSAHRHQTANKLKLQASVIASLQARVSEQQGCIRQLEVRVAVRHRRQASTRSGTRSVSAPSALSTDGPVLEDRLFLLKADLNIAKESLAAANDDLRDQMELFSDLSQSLAHEKDKTRHLYATLDRKEKELGALRQAHFALECQYKNAKETFEAEKDELEDAVFAAELERDILVKTEAELSEALEEKIRALTACRAQVEAEHLAAQCALEDSEAAHSKVVALEVTVQEEVARSAGLRDEISKLQTTIQDRDQYILTTQEEIINFKAQLKERGDPEGEQQTISSLKVSLEKAEQQVRRLGKQLQEEREEHRETQNELEVVNSLVFLDPDSVQDSVEETSPNMGLNVPSWELGQQSAELDTDKGQASLEDALLVKTDRCEELEEQVARLIEHIRMLKKDTEWHTVVPPAEFESVPSQKRTLQDKENIRSAGSLHDVNMPRASPVRRMTTDSLISQASTLIQSSDSPTRNRSSRLFNSQSLRKFFIPTQLKKPAAADLSAESPALEYAESLTDAHRIAEELSSSAPLI